MRSEGIYAIPIFSEPLLVEIFDDDTNPLEMVVVIPYIPLFGWERSGLVKRITKTIQHNKWHVLRN
jgi:hypothetical protein